MILCFIDFLAPTHHVKYDGFCVRDLQNSNNTQMFANAPRKLRWILRSRQICGPLSSKIALRNRSRKRNAQISRHLPNMTSKTTPKWMHNSTPNANSIDVAFVMQKSWRAAHFCPPIRLQRIYKKYEMPLLERVCRGHSKGSFQYVCWLAPDCTTVHWIV